MLLRPPVVLLVEDEPELRTSLASALGQAEFDVVEAANGLDALRELSARDVDVVVLDASMPVLDGIETCRRIRAAGRDIPVLMLTVRDELDHRLAGFEAGADDSVLKPIASSELVARLRALARRAARHAAPDRSLLRYADLHVDRLSRRAWRGQRELKLTPTEFLLLEQLALHPEEVLERRTLMLRVWGFDCEGESNSLAVYVGYLRRKLEGCGEPRLIWTVRAVGLILRTDAD